MASEFDFIHKIRQRAVNTGSELILGIGDDTAIFAERNGRERLITADLLIEEIHFKLTYTPFNFLGHKTLAVSISDIAAMGGTPEFALLSLGIPKSHWLDSEWEKFFDGYFALAQKYNIALIGGDTCASPEKLILDSIVIGNCAKGKALRRSGAQSGDMIFVTGNLGASAVGLQLLLQGHRFDENIDNLFQQAIRSHLKPEPRISFGQKIGQAELAHAMMDVSDGLAQDLAHICEESQVDAVIDFDAVPIAESATLITDSIEQAFLLAISGGEDYELLLTADRNNEEKLLNIASECQIQLTRIGEIIDREAQSSGPRLFRRKNGRVDLLAVTGYDHFQH